MGASFRTKEQTMDIHTQANETSCCEIFYVPYRYVAVALAFVLGIAAFCGH